MNKKSAIWIDIENKDILDEIQYKFKKRTHKRVSYNDILSELLELHKAQLV